MELFARIGNGRPYSQWTIVFACCCVTQTSLPAKFKLDENGHALKAASDTISCFSHFSENANYFYLVNYFLTKVLFRFEN